MGKKSKRKINKPDLLTIEKMLMGATAVVRTVNRSLHQRADPSDADTERFSEVYEEIETLDQALVMMDHTYDALDRVELDVAHLWDQLKKVRKRKKRKWGRKKTGLVMVG